MKNFLEIKPNEGLGDFMFGETAADILSFFGQPDETEDLVEDEEHVRIISYWEKGLVFFLEGDDYAYFSCVESDNEDLTLFGQNVIGLTKEALLSLLEEKGFNEFEEEDEEWGEKRISCDDLGIDFFFEDDELISVSWAEPIYEEED